MTILGYREPCCPALGCNLKRTREVPSSRALHILIIDIPIIELRAGL